MRRKFFGSITMKPRTPIALLFLFVAIAASAGGLAVWGLPALRAAQEVGKRPHATLQIAAHPPRILFSTTDHETSAGGGPEDYERYKLTQSRLVKSQLVLSAALQDAGVAQLASIKNLRDPVAWLERVVQVTHSKDNELLQISIAAGSGASYDDQAAIINAVVRA
jgi:hypothetical protein